MVHTFLSALLSAFLVGACASEGTFWPLRCVEVGQPYQKNAGIKKTGQSGKSGPDQTKKKTGPPAKKKAGQSDKKDKNKDWPQQEKVGQSDDEQKPRQLHQQKAGQSGKTSARQCPFLGAGDTVVFAAGFNIVVIGEAQYTCKADMQWKTVNQTMCGKALETMVDPFANWMLSTSFQAFQSLGVMSLLASFAGRRHLRFWVVLLSYLNGLFGACLAAAVLTQIWIPSDALIDMKRLLLSIPIVTILYDVPVWLIKTFAECCHRPKEYVGPPAQTLIVFMLGVMVLGKSLYSWAATWSYTPAGIVIVGHHPLLLAPLIFLVDLPKNMIVGCMRNGNFGPPPSRQDRMKFACSAVFFKSINVLLPSGLEAACYSCEVPCLLIADPLPEYVLYNFPDRGVTTQGTERERAALMR